MPLKQSEIVDLVSELIALDSLYAEFKQKLQKREALLIAEAEAHPEEAEATEQGGRSWAFAGRNGAIARVTQSAPKLKSKIECGSKECKRLDMLLGTSFYEAFEQDYSHKPKKNFRKIIAALFSKNKKKAALVLEICTGKGSVSVSYETKANA